MMNVQNVVPAVESSGVPSRDLMDTTIITQKGYSKAKQTNFESGEDSNEPSLPTTPIVRVCNPQFSKGSK